MRRIFFFFKLVNECVWEGGVFRTEESSSQGRRWTAVNNVASFLFSGHDFIILFVTASL